MSAKITKDQFQSDKVRVAAAIKAAEASKSENLPQILRNLGQEWSDAIMAENARIAEEARLAQLAAEAESRRNLVAAAQVVMTEGEIAAVQEISDEKSARAKNMLARKAKKTELAERAAEARLAQEAAKAAKALPLENPDVPEEGNKGKIKNPHGAKERRQWKDLQRRLDAETY